MSDPSMLSNLGVTVSLAFLPVIAIAGTAFIKIALVLAILRSALGAPGVPPTSVLTALAVVLTMFVMGPVSTQMLDCLESLAAFEQTGDPLGIAQARSLYDSASGPLLDFLYLNTPDSEIAFFSELAGNPPLPEPGLTIMLPAFASGELIEAFLIGFLLFIPFWVIDLIIANTLLALGMHMTQPAAISLPLKLLLFIAVDGWHIVLGGIMVNYQT